jgi:hypothetical protein
MQTTNFKMLNSYSFLVIPQFIILCIHFLSISVSFIFSCAYFFPLYKILGSCDSNCADATYLCAVVATLCLILHVPSWNFGPHTIFLQTLRINDSDASGLNKYSISACKTSGRNFKSYFGSERNSEMNSEMY